MLEHGWCAAAADKTVAIYADAIRGADDNDGRSPQSAYRTLNAAHDAVDAAIREGAELTLYLARGSVWREFRESPADESMSFGARGLQVLAYGEGELPTLSGFMVLPNNNFQQFSFWAGEPQHLSLPLPRVPELLRRIICADPQQAAHTPNVF